MNLLTNISLIGYPGKGRFLRVKTTSKNVLCLYSGSGRLDVCHTEKHLGDDYFQTNKGIFRFKFVGFYGKSPCWFKVIGALPKPMPKTTDGSDEE